MTFDEYAVAWSALHGDVDPDRAGVFVRGWLRVAYVGGSVLARWRVSPWTVTAVGLLLCAAVPAAALLGPTGLLLGAVLVLLAGFADGLDGAVAVVSGRTSRLGFVVDSVADRLGEVAWLVAFRVAGAPGWLVVAAGAVSWIHEYVRARATAGGMRDVGVVTVSERPTRVCVGVAGLVLGGLVGLMQPAWAGETVTAAVVLWLVLGVVGLAQIGSAVRRAFA